MEDSSDSSFCFDSADEGTRVCSFSEEIIVARCLKLSDVDSALLVEPLGRYDEESRHFLPEIQRVVHSVWRHPKLNTPSGRLHNTSTLQQLVTNTSLRFFDCCFVQPASTVGR